MFLMSEVLLYRMFPHPPTALRGGVSKVNFPRFSGKPGPTVDEEALRNAPFSLSLALSLSLSLSYSLSLSPSLSLSFSLSEYFRSLSRLPRLQRGGGCLRLSAPRTLRAVCVTEETLSPDPVD